MIPVGVRGDRRDERFAFNLALEAVTRRVTPEQLALGRAWKRSSRSWLAPIAQLSRVEAVLVQFGYAWGPAGSVGYEFVSGVPTVTASSDLDLVIRVPERLSPKRAALLHRLLANEHVRVDARLALPRGFINLAELANGEAKLLLRTAVGPLMVRDPWVQSGAES